MLPSSPTTEHGADAACSYWPELLSITAAEKPRGAAAAAAALSCGCTTQRCEVKGEEESSAEPLKSAYAQAR
ncbi:hypothetical protein JOB18_038760 [Solea senegalensis]|uniref:Uncharacterized protein n=1 Tax=Solea senegalensis TaxID=28829 RepID=A0AAV6S0Z9_SOLSE|nr:hypothetical protein JOB18_038760 [Solea senegalensis]